MNVEEKRKELLEKNQKVYFKSNFGFINRHKGFRPSNLHLFIGTPSGGKSTLMRSLLLDVLEEIKNNEKILLWLSEESEEDFLTEIFYSTNVTAPLHKIKIISETDFLDMKPIDKFKVFAKEVSSMEYSFIFFDNITTSAFYMDRKVDDQSTMAANFKKIANGSKVPVILFAHTGAQIADNNVRLIDQNDIRGSKTIVNLIQFCYIMQRFHIGDAIFPTIKITKHRGQIVNNKIFKLVYSESKRIYESDVELSFKDFNEAFKDRNVLGRR